MLYSKLNTLMTDRFQLRFYGMTTPTSLHRCLSIDDTVCRLKSAVADGKVTSEDIRQFVEELLRSFRSGQRFPHDITLAALAVILEASTLPIADEYIEELAGLTCVEMAMCSRVARECLKYKNVFVNNGSQRSANAEHHQSSSDQTGPSGPL